MLEELFGTSQDYRPAMAFYGPVVFEAIRRQEAEEREQYRIKRETENDRIDDAAWQLADYWKPTP